MKTGIEGVLERINNLDTLIWRLYGKAVEYRDHELRILVGTLGTRHDEIFRAISELKRNDK